MNVLIIGAGNMGGAIAKALAAGGQKVFVYDVNPAKAKALAGKNIFAATSLANLPKAGVVIVAVKPQDIGGLNMAINSQTILLSIAAGVPIKKLQTVFRHQKVVRLMPNLGLLVGQGIAGWKSASLSKQEKAAMRGLLNKISENFEVDKESDIDAITAVSGSGPAYFFQFAEYLRQAAVSLGLKKTQARRLVEKTFLAAAMLQKNTEYQELIAQVRSKKGTTDAALKVFGQKNLSKIVSAAAEAAKNRAKELSYGQ